MINLQKLDDEFLKYICYYLFYFIFAKIQLALKINLNNLYILFIKGRRVIGISGSQIWSKTLMDVIFNPCGEFWWSLEDPVSQICSPHLHVGAYGIFSDLLKYVQMRKKEWGVESNGKLSHLIVPDKTAALVPEFAVEDLPSAELQPWFLHFAVKDLPLGRTHWWWFINMYIADFNPKKYRWWLTTFTSDSVSNVSGIFKVTITN